MHIMLSMDYIDDGHQVFVATLMEKLLLVLFTVITSSRLVTFVHCIACEHCLHVGTYGQDIMRMAHNGLPLL